MRLNCLIVSLLLLTGCFRLAGDASTQYRGGIEFLLANPTIEEVSGQDWFCFDVLARSTGTSERMGSGLVLLNYNTDAFGSGVVAEGNAAVIPGQLLNSGIFPIYHVISADHAAHRLAITYEYMFMSGYGNLLTLEYQTLASIKLKILYATGNSGLTFETALMHNNQFLDDNLSLFAPVLTGPALLYQLSNTPQDICLGFDGEDLILSWEDIPYSTYNVYAASSPDSEDWQLVASQLLETVWVVPETHMGFYRVTAVTPDTSLMIGGSRCD